MDICELTLDWTNERKWQQLSSRRPASCSAAGKKRNLQNCFFAAEIHKPISCHLRWLGTSPLPSCTRGVVHEEQVDIIQHEIIQRLSAVRLDVLGVVLVVPEFAAYEQLFPDEKLRRRMDNSSCEAFVTHTFRYQSHPRSL